MAVKVVRQDNGENWQLYHGDAVEVARGLPDNSIHYNIHSPPFSSLYTFSDDPRDISNNNSASVFWEHYNFLIKEYARACMPGRLVSVHCMNLPTSKTNDGFIGLRDFRGEIIEAHKAAGLIFHSEVVIWKNPVIAMQRTKALGLLHKQIVKDSAMSRMGIPDYVVTFRKPGDNPERVSGAFTEYYGDGSLPAEDPQVYEGHVAGSYSVDVWQRYASPIWMDINPSDVLSKELARDEQDERHIAPLQLTVIRRCIDLWTNPGDVVFSPFAGIGSELYVALQMGRKALGVELKESYYKQALANVKYAATAPRGLVVEE